MSRNCCVILILSVLGCLIVALGIGLIWEFAHIIQEKINSAVLLKNGSESYDNWLEPPADVYMEFYVFNVLNDGEILKDGAKPCVEQRGPYTYREIRPKIDVNFHENNTLISYRQPKTYIFEPDMSVGNDSDKFMTVNLLMLAIGDRLKGNTWTMKLLRAAVMVVLDSYEEKFFDNYTVHDYIFGYEDPVIAEINKLSEEYLKIKLIKEDMIGLFAGAAGNGTDDGLYKVHTGIGKVQDLNVVQQWNGSSVLSYWSTPQCNMINGTDGSMWHPFVEKTDRLYIFSSDICRSIYVEYEDTREALEIPVLRFTAPPEVFANKTVNPDNAGFCNPDCFGSGILDVKVCKGAPVVISQPHFYEAAQEYIDAIDGMKPSQQYMTYIDIEPHTGVALNVSKKLQLNAHIIEDSSISGKMVETIFPLVWLNENAAVDAVSAAKIKHEVMLPVLILACVQWGLVALGSLLLCLSLAMLLTRVICRDKHEVDSDSQPIITQVQDNDTMRGDI